MNIIDMNKNIVEILKEKLFELTGDKYKIFRQSEGYFKIELDDYYFDREDVGECFIGGYRDESDDVTYFQIFAPLKDHDKIIDLCLNIFQLKGDNND